MLDDKSKPGKQDRRRAASGQTYELGYFARKYRISTDQAEKILRQARGSREQANTLAHWRRHLHLRQRALIGRLATNGPAPRTNMAMPTNNSAAKPFWL
jgi:hypothetical protein